MVEISEYLWECLYVMKQVYDHDPKAHLLQFYGNNVIDGDDIYEVSMNALNQFFVDTRYYFNEEKEIETHVFFDPIITECWKLCDEYEAQNNLQPKDDEFRRGLESSLESALYVPDYSYDGRWYADTKRRGGCRLVLLCGCEFYGHCYLPAALSEAYDAFIHYRKRLKEALNSTGGAEIVTLPVAKLSEKEAA
jgi:hypothetical protein